MNSSSDLELHHGRCKPNWDAAELSSSTSTRQQEEWGIAAGWEAEANECERKANRRGLSLKHQLYKHYLINILRFLSICLCLSLVRTKREVSNNIPCQQYLLLALTLDNAFPVDPSSTGRGTPQLGEHRPWPTYLICSSTALKRHFLHILPMVFWDAAWLNKGRY